MAEKYEKSKNMVSSASTVLNGDLFVENKEIENFLSSFSNKMLNQRIKRFKNEEKHQDFNEVDSSEKNGGAVKLICTRRSSKRIKLSLVGNSTEAVVDSMSEAFEDPSGMADYSEFKNGSKFTKRKERPQKRRNASTTPIRRYTSDEEEKGVTNRDTTKDTGGRRRSNEQGYNSEICVGAKYQVPRVPDFYLNSADFDRPVAFKPYTQPSKLVFSQELLQLHALNRMREGREDRCIKTDTEMRRFINRCAYHWKSAPGWQPFSPEFGYKLLHNAQYDPERAIVMLNDPYFNFAAICDPPIRKYDNKWRPNGRRGEHPSCPFPPMHLPRRSNYFRHATTQFTRTY